MQRSRPAFLYWNWLREGDEIRIRLEHLEYLDAHVHTGHCWLNRHHAGHPAFHTRWSFYETAFVTTKVNVGHRKIPAADDYAHHIDVARFLGVLQDAGVGVKHVVDTVKGVRLDADGNIEAVVTDEHGALQADLYVDCSGFRRILIWS